MKTAIISSSQLLEHGRWDAAFHIVVKETKAQVEAMKEGEDEAYALLSHIDTQTLRSLHPLVRDRRVDRESLLRAAMEYPKIALCLVRNNLDQDLQRVEADIADRETLRKRMIALKGDN